MTAIAEARALLDQLMGGDRDADLPPGAALPGRKRKNGAVGGEGLLLPGKRHKSCYDNDICPLYCAWGVDVYELFVNTKSDIGPNPYKPDDSARNEYLGLPDHEKERLGFEYYLFVKLQELVQQCDRTVQRNTDKLNKEIHRQMHKRGNADYVHAIDEVAAEQVCRNQVLVEELTEQIDEALHALGELKSKEDRLKHQLERETKGAESEADRDKAEVKPDPDAGDTSPSAAADETPVKTDDSAGKTQVLEDGNSNGDNEKEQKDDEKLPTSLKLGRLALEKQALICDIARKITELGPLHETIESQLRNLDHLKSDTTTDKTVCEVSGNFMSARDADERIAAHYAGKQYVGWKLVRDKYKEMLEKYGKYGPPPPGRRGPPPADRPSVRGSSSSYGGYDRRGGSSGGRYHESSRSGYDRRSSSSHRSDGRWERGGGSGYDRGGRYDRGGGGGYDRSYDSRGGGYDRGRRGGGGGGWGRR